MGVYINMEIPKNCGVCRFVGSCGVHTDNEEWPDLESIIFNDVIGIDGVRDPDCPLVPVPPHGRLIDANAVERNLVKMQMAQKGATSHGIRKSRAVIRDMATIIPAEESNMDSFIHIFEEDDEEDEMNSFIRILKD